MIAGINRTAASTSMTGVLFLLLSGWLVLCLAAPPASGEDWPTYMKDNSRSGVTSESLPHLSRLREIWVHESPAPPRVAWDGGAPWDAWRSNSAQNTCALTPMRDFDFVHFVTVSGADLYFGSSVTDSVHCLDRVTGEERWFFTTNGAVRYPPSVDDGRLFVGSDDGHVYCIDGADGSFIWKYTPSGETRLIGNNGGFIPMWPVRTGTAVADGKVYFAASLVNWETSYLCAIDAQSGSDTGSGLYKAAGGVTPMGAILISPSKIYLLQGRLHPHVFDRANGALLGKTGNFGNGGCFALLTSDSRFAHGHAKVNDSGFETREFDADTLDKLATHPDGRCLVVAGGEAYVVTGNDLSALNRSSGGTIWSVDCDCPYALILAGDTLFAGGDGVVRAYGILDGVERWSAVVKGRARGLAVAKGGLFVSTDRGHIHAFSLPSRTYFPVR